jgi:hypothetical protein
MQGFHPPIYVNSQWNFSNETGGVFGKSMRLNVGIRSISALIFSASRKGPMLVEEVSITMPLPKSVKIADIKVNMGTVLL